MVQSVCGLCQKVIFFDIFLTCSCFCQQTTWWLLELCYLCEELQFVSQLADRAGCFVCKQLPAEMAKMSEVCFLSFLKFFWHGRWFRVTDIA